MSISLSFVLQLPPSTAYAKLDDVAKNLLLGICKMLESDKVRFSLFMDGPTLTAASNAAKPLMFGKLRKAIEDDKLEILGGGFYDAMLPLFPTELQRMQLEHHSKLLWKLFGTEPSGYFNSSMVWEMEMTELLERARFEYALVQESALQDALGRTTPISGWYTLEDKGAFMRVVPISQRLSEAIANDNVEWLKIAKPYCRDSKSAVVSLDIPPQPSDIVPFFERLIDFVETNEISTKTVSSLVNAQNSEGKISFLLSAGQNLGLPLSAKTCRELLVRRPEINLLHKTLLSLYHRAISSLDAKQFNEFLQMLLPAMSPLYFRDMQDSEGMRTPMVRWWGARFLVQAANKLASLISLEGIRLDVTDFMLEGRKFICAENSSYSFLLDYFCGGILRILNAKNAENNLLSSWRDDGNPAVEFLDFIVSNTEQVATKLDEQLADREGALFAPYDYCIKRNDTGTNVELLSEQEFTQNGLNATLHIEKFYKLLATGNEFSLDYKITNNAFTNINAFFGTLFETGLLACGTDKKNILVDGAELKFNFCDPLIYPDAKIIEIRDYVTACRIRMCFHKNAYILVAPIFGALSLAAPKALQGIRIFPFWKLKLNSLADTSIKITMQIFKE